MKSFKDVGRKAFGNHGKVMVEVLLVVTQTGFVTSYVYFIYSQLHGVFAYYGIETEPWHFGKFTMV